MKPHRLAIALSASLALAACGSDEAPQPAAPAAEQAPAPATRPAPSTPPVTNTPSTPAPSAGFGPRRPSPRIGVAACDQFLAFYRQCIAKAPEEARGGMQTALESWQGTWRTLAASPTTQGSLEQTCQSAADSVRTQMEGYGCDL